MFHRPVECIWVYRILVFSILISRLCHLFTIQSLCATEQGTPLPTAPVCPYVTYSPTTCLACHKTTCSMMINLLGRTGASTKNKKWNRNSCLPLWQKAIRELLWSWGRAPPICESDQRNLQRKGEHLSHTHSLCSEALLPQTLPYCPGTYFPPFSLMHLINRAL